MAYDAHIHLDHVDYDADRDDVIARAHATGVEGWTVVGSDPARWDLAVSLARATCAPVACGVHPWQAPDLDEAALQSLLARLVSLPVQAIGEFGLDALWAPTPLARERQRSAVRHQLALARERGLPVVFHAVRAVPELLTLAERDGVPDCGGQWHAWSGPPDQIGRALALGHAISFGPLVLRDRAMRARKSVPLVPLDRLLVETDGPSMAPIGVVRGEMAHIHDVIREVAALRGESVHVVEAATQDNARRLFSARSAER